jgi:hypothetical protein
VQLLGVYQICSTADGTSVHDAHFNVFSSNDEHMSGSRSLVGPLPTAHD